MTNVYTEKHNDNTLATLNAELQATKAQLQNVREQNQQLEARIVSLENASSST